MEIRSGLYYSKEHEWVRVDGDKAYVGITDYAQHSLGDIVFVELPDVGAEYSSEDRLGIVESVKAVADVQCPVSGKVLEVNKDLEDSPEALNQQPYDAWLVAMEMTNKAELDQLMGPEEYKAFIKEA